MTEKITPEQMIEWMEGRRAHRNAFEELTIPLINWLNENANPHSTIIIKSDYAELMSGEICVKKPQEEPK